jgi:hypothetical protein
MNENITRPYFKCTLCTRSTHVMIGIVIQQSLMKFFYSIRFVHPVRGRRHEPSRILVFQENISTTGLCSYTFNGWNGNSNHTINQWRVWIFHSWQRQMQHLLVWQCPRISWNHNKALLPKLQCLTTLITTSHTSTSRPWHSHFCIHSQGMNNMWIIYWSC